MTARRSDIVSASSWSWVTYEERDPDLALDALELDLELAAELRVERAERLVEEEDRGRQDERTRERDALLLAARELMRTPLRRARRAGRAPAPRRHAAPSLVASRRP